MSVCEYVSLHLVNEILPTAGSYNPFTLLGGEHDGSSAPILNALILQEYMCTYGYSSDL